MRRSHRAPRADVDGRVRVALVLLPPAEHQRYGGADGAAREGDDECCGDEVDLRAGARLAEAEDAPLDRGPERCGRRARRRGRGGSEGYMRLRRRRGAVRWCAAVGGAGERGARARRHRELPWCRGGTGGKHRGHLEPRRVARVHVDPRKQRTLEVLRRVGVQVHFERLGPLAAAGVHPQHVPAAQRGHVGSVECARSREEAARTHCIAACRSVQIRVREHAHVAEDITRRNGDAHAHAVAAKGDDADNGGGQNEVAGVACLDEVLGIHDANGDAELARMRLNRDRRRVRGGAHRGRRDRLRDELLGEHEVHPRADAVPRVRIIHRLLPRDSCRGRVGAGGGVGDGPGAAAHVAGAGNVHGDRHIGAGLASEVD
mmetsp:Transcript_47163/g.145465  ORF Transcript_47163/g.145465 Transcript_47163/m.145465 type:complete len:374 (-) Transcript_47163:1655-2776(-)